MKLLFKLELLLLLTGISCQSVSRAGDDDVDQLLWSVKMASTVINTHESLVYYNRRAGKEKLQYDVAMLAMAIDKLGSTEEKYSVYLKNYIDFFVDSTGNIEKYKIEEYNLDRINFAKNLITLYKRTGDEKYNLAIEQFVRQIENHPKTKSGGFWHKKVYPWQMWLDGSYMSAPFIAQYAKEFNKTAWFDLATFQLIHIYEMTLDHTSGLLYHAWDESRTQKWCDPRTGQSKEFWGRSIGWYMMALVDVLDYLPENHPHHRQIIEILNNISEAVMKVRDPESLVWYQVPDKGALPNNYLEASCSGMFVYAFAKGAQHGYLPSRYFDIAQESFNAMLREFIIEGTDDNLTITNICGGCGLGGSPYRDGSYEYYVSEKQVENDPKGVGAFILAAIELNR